MTKRGFTLIELLVVLSIISLIASIALGAISVARKKAADAAIKSELIGARPQAELFYDSNNGSYVRIIDQTTTNRVCSTGPNNIFPLLVQAANISHTVLRTGTVVTNTEGLCNDKPDDLNGPTGWAAEIPLVENPSTKFCVDFRGTARIVTGSALGNPSLPQGSDVSCDQP